MTGIAFIFIGVVAALPVLFLLVHFTRGPKKADKVEKAEIMKRLLALAEQEGGDLVGGTPASGNLPRVPGPAPAHPAPQNGARSPISSARLITSAADTEIDAQIRQRAYELYQGRGGVGGNAADDWRQAREDVMKRKAKAATTTSSS